MVDTYVPLHNHTYFSQLDGYSSPEEYLQRCTELGISSFAITEHGNQYSWVYFEKLKEKYPSIKIIYGVEFYECDDINIKDKNNKYYHLIVLAKNENGRKAINELITRSNFDGFYFKGRVDLDMFKPFGKDLVVSSACLASKLSREKDYNKCVDYIKEYKSVFPHFYLEMQSHSHEDQAEYNKKILKLSKETNTPYIITTDSHTSKKEDLYYQKYHVNTANDSETINEIYEGCYVQSVDEIHKIMDSQVGHEAVENGLLNTIKVSELIEEVKMPFQEPQLPTFPLPLGFSDSTEYLKKLCLDGWKFRKLNKLAYEEQKIYLDRLNYELEVIDKMKFPGYFLIVWDFIEWARNNDVEVGAGRGSAAGSLVCYLLKISDLNPIKYGLIFERFLNPERVGMPDIDIDLSDRGKVIKYLENKYGEHNVCQIINYNYITPLTAIEDVGKILGFTYKEMRSLSSKFSYDTFDKCVEVNKDYLDKNPKYNDLIDIAGHLCGRLKTVSCHAGGVGIVDTNISDYMGMKLGSKGEHIIQVNKKIIEEIGIIKFDLLGVQTLSMVHEIKKDLNMDSWEININNPEFENSVEPYKVLNVAKTNGVFQTESSGMKDLLIRLRAKNISDVSVVLALYRPDTMGALNDYIDTKNGDKVIHNIHPKLDEILKETNNCLLYQEQLMDIVRIFGGRTYGGADKFRKGIGKKDTVLVKQEARKLYQEIIDNNFEEVVAKTISEDMENKGGYLFNKSHSYSYSVLTLQTAYLKSKYPLYFFKALFNLNKDKVGMLNKYILDSRDFNINVKTPDINKSELNFSIQDDSIVFGLSAISSIGENVASRIIEERNGNGIFKNFDDFITRTNLDKGQVIMLIKSGAIPCKNKHNRIVKYLKSLYSRSEFKCSTKLPSYQKLIMDWDINCEDYRIGKKKYDFDKNKMYEEYKKRAYKKYLEKEEVKYQKFIDENNKYLYDEEFWEFQALQIFIGNNPFDESYQYITTSFMDTKIHNECVVPGIISKVQKKKDKNKNTFAFLNLYTTFGILEILVWSSQFKQYESLLKKGNKITVLCKKESEEKAICLEVKVYEEWMKYIKHRKR